MNNKYNTCFKLFSMLFSSRKNKIQQLAQEKQSQQKTTPSTKSVQGHEANPISASSFLTPSLKPATTDLK